MVVMDFVKMHGCGNDFVVVNAIDRLPDNPQKLATMVCNRRYGIGSDGLVFVMSSKKADLRMRFFNPDGSEAEMCGNAIRCFAKFVKAENIFNDDYLKVETPAGIICTEDAEDNKVRVDMGEPILEGHRIPVNIPKDRVVNENLQVGEKLFHMTCVSMGNPHCIIFVPEITDELVLKQGPVIEKHSLFPKKTNTEFIKIINRSEINMRVYERGAGETLACGTGACAAAVAGVLNGFTDRKCRVHLLGGDLDIEWSEKNNHVFLTGPVETVFQGKWLLDSGI